MRVLVPRALSQLRCFSFHSLLLLNCVFFVPSSLVREPWYIVPRCQWQSISGLSVTVLFLSLMLNKVWQDNIVLMTKNDIQFKMNRPAEIYKPATVNLPQRLPNYHTITSKHRPQTSYPTKCLANTPSLFTTSAVTLLHNIPMPPTAPEHTTTLNIGVFQQPITKMGMHA